MMKIIVPCCGQSTRYPDQPPKYLLPGYDGRPMLALALQGLDIKLDDVVVAVLDEHERKYAVSAGIQKALGKRVQVLIHLHKTRSQAETVARTLEMLGTDDAFLVKDSDNCFTLGDISQATNYVAVESLNHFDSINPRNKSYVQTDHAGVITNIREKQVVSDLFSVGGYWFTQPALFLEQFRRLEAHAAASGREIYISDVIAAMLLDGVPFRAREVTGYEDWGTIHEWRLRLGRQRAYIAMLDGFVFERGSAYFAPRFEDAKPNPVAVEALKELKARGHSVMYLSLRPETLRALTEAQIDAAGVPRGAVLYGCPLGAVTLISAPHATLPLRSVTAVEVSPEDPSILERLREEGS